MEKDNKDIKEYKKEIFEIQSILFDLGYENIKVSGYIEYINFNFKVYNSNVFDGRVYDKIKLALKKYNIILDLSYDSKEMRFFMTIKLYDKEVDILEVL